jgi:murein DD-endopeptidase MepM/ murein hydrolase activator NlpD
MERKAAAAGEKDRRRMEEEERAEAATWAVGSNAKLEARMREEDEKAMARAAKKAEIERQLEEESQGVVAARKTKKKGKDDFDKLNEALAAVPKTKAQREAEAANKRKEEALRLEAERRERRLEEERAQEEVRKRAAARGIVVDHSESLLLEANPNHRHLEDSEDAFESATGLENAIDALAVGGAGAEDQHPEKRLKALYNAFFERNLPEMKESHPGLKLSQYKERIFEMWKTSPENPTFKPR